MNKLTKKFVIGIVIILGASFLCSALFNVQFIERYYLYQKRGDMLQIRNAFTDLLQEGHSSQSAVEQIEASHKVIISEIENTPASDNDEVNEKIQAAFQEKGIGFQKYWFWEEDYKKVLGGEHQIRLYEQEKLDYSLLIDYTQKDSSLYAITMIVPNVSDAFQIANRFLMVVTAATILIAILVITLLIKRITKPLQLFEHFAERMKNNEFVPVEIHTNDELMSVADSLNSMGNQITLSQESLQEKNRQMEHLLDSVAHDLKTPISLIQLYADGIKDGMDDGTFLDTILEENRQMSHMTERLLYLARLGKQPDELSAVPLSDMIQQLIDNSSILAKENRMKIHSSLETDIVLSGSTELLQSLFLNLITNAMNYSSGPEIIINLLRQEHEIIFTIANKTDNTMLDAENIWTPYYVGESSRNKKLSGTGLGLSIVRRICETQHYCVQCLLQEGWISFTVSIPF